jgi:hypothetical protein
MTVSEELEIEQGPAVKPPDENLQIVPAPDAPRGPLVGSVLPTPNPGRVFNVPEEDIEAARKLDPNGE